MKRTLLAFATILVVFVALIAGLVLRPVQKVKARQGCSNRTLLGDYGLVGSGFALVSGSNQPASMVGLLHFDGEGNLTGSNVYTVKDGSVSGPDTVPAGASYSVSTDCTVTMSFSASFGSHGVVVGEYGSEVVGDLENSGGTATGTIEVKKAADWDDR